MSNYSNTIWLRFLYDSDNDSNYYILNILIDKQTKKEKNVAYQTIWYAILCLYRIYILCLYNVYVLLHKTLVDVYAGFIAF